ncbi:hypothetical protein [Risungbinella massiliensis]|uniref:hypothetical protein n=1 Tax=Risungbinella massiliensis TaxID=1329796 RepID=UPI0005CC1F4C|nr:hypothetical protein [Risungbinella massiliensis]
MIEKLDAEIIDHLRQLARNGKSVEEMLRYLIGVLQLTKDSRLIVILYFKEAFLLRLGDISKLGAWNFFEGGTWDIEMIEDEIKPLINKGLKSL